MQDTIAASKELLKGKKVKGSTRSGKVGSRKSSRKTAGTTTKSPSKPATGKGDKQNKTARNTTKATSKTAKSTKASATSKVSATKKIKRTKTIEDTIAASKKILGKGRGRTAAKGRGKKN